MILFIDATDFNHVIFALSDGKKIRKGSYKIDPHESHKTLQKLEQFLRPVKGKKLKVKGIMVNSGPGSFTGTRIGVTIGQALGFAWQVPVKFLPKNKFQIK